MDPSKNLTSQELELQQKILKGLKVNKSQFVKRYGADAEKVMYGVSIQKAKSEAENQNKTKLKEIIRKILK